MYVNTPEKGLRVNYLSNSTTLKNKENTKIIFICPSSNYIFKLNIKPVIKIV